MKMSHKGCGPSKEVEKEIVSSSAPSKGNKKTLFPVKKKDKKNGKR